MLTDVSGNVKIDHVDFSYVPEKELIKDLNLDVKSGRADSYCQELLSGCGKTTIINLLMRFYDTDKGGISVDGNNIKDVTRDSLRLSYGMSASGNIGIYRRAQSVEIQLTENRTQLKKKL